MTSPFAPTILPKLPDITGLTLSVTTTNMRYKGRHDLLTVRFKEEAVTAGVFTRSSMPSAPVDFCRQALAKGQKAKILCVNAGHSNAFTGKAGEKTVQDVANIISHAEHCSPDAIYQASTGVIGQKFSGEELAKHILNNKNKASWEDAARAIMTTDTFPKMAGRSMTLSSGEIINFSAIAKGSGMIAPDMGTMLAFIFTDAVIDMELLQTLLQEVTDKSFNAITVDGDTSTSDTLQIFATGTAGNPPLTKGNDLELLTSTLLDICRDLALQIVKDGEGISKFVKINIHEAETPYSARKIGLSIANSPLVKTAIAGEDANWGRIVMAIGKSGEKANRDKTSISIGGIMIAQNGEAIENYDEAPVTAHMKGCEIDIDVAVGVGQASATVYTCDLTHAYIDINADYRS